MHTRGHSAASSRARPGRRHLSVAHLRGPPAAAGPSTTLAGGDRRSLAADQGTRAPGPDQIAPGRTPRRSQPARFTVSLLGGALIDTGLPQSEYVTVVVVPGTFPPTTRLSTRLGRLS